MSCVQGCTCTDEECLEGCLSSADQACGMAVASLSSCSEASCEDTCAGGSGTEPTPAECGDDIAQSDEECDGTDIPADCADFGFDGGTVVCQDCELDTSACINETPDPGSFCEGEAIPLSVPSVTEGVLEEGDPTDGPRSGSFYDLYSVSLTAGQSITVTHVSEAFDPFLYLYDLDGCVELASDDDGAGNLDSLITFTATGDATVLIFATALGGNGAYTLSIATRDAAQVSGPVGGSWSPAGPRLATGPGRAQNAQHLERSRQICECCSRSG